MKFAGENNTRETDTSITIAMAYCLHNNGVLTGTINSYCLACEVFLKTEKDANEHIGLSPHKKKLGGIPYSEKFQDERIRKFKNGYYCEFCNTLLPIAAKVSLHITDEDHKHNKGNLLLKLEGNNIIAFNNILIEENVWHGLIEEICSICNTEFDDENAHKNNLEHSLNMVLKPVRFGDKNAIYRKIDNSAVHCLTCNQLLSPSTMNKHFSDAEHLQLYNKQQIQNYINPVTENGKDIKNNKESDDNNNEKSDGHQKSKILEFLSSYQNKGININLETETAFCKKCSEVIKFEVTEIENHIENHGSAKIDTDLQYPSNFNHDLNKLDINDKSAEEKSADYVNGFEDKTNESSVSDSTACSVGSESTKKPEEKNKVKFDKEAIEFAVENEITFNQENNNAYCRICEVRLPSSFRSLKEHVAGANHKIKSKSKKAAEQPKTSQPKPTTPALSKTDTRNYVDTAFDVSGLFCRDTIVNEEFCLPQLSFWLITKMNSRYRCHLCDIYLPINIDVETHAKTKYHATRCSMVPVITSEKSEFIREVRPGLFHCGFCNLLVSSWTDMQQHLKCNEHKEKKSSCEHRLEIHLPDLQEYKMRKEMHTLQLLWFLNRFN